MRPSKQTIIVTMRAVGFHRWPDAPAEVAYLALNHRHEFHLRVEAVVSHGDRELEFHMLKRVVRELWDVEIEWGAMSCEHIAIRLADQLEERGKKVSAVEVFEDGECGARVEF